MRLLNEWGFLAAAAVVLVGGHLAVGQGIQRKGPIPTFKPGDVVRTWKPDGSERSSGPGYRVVSVENGWLFVEDLGDKGNYKAYDSITMELKDRAAAAHEPKREPAKSAPGVAPAAQGGPIGLLTGEILDGATIRVSDGRGNAYLVPANDPSLLATVRGWVRGGSSRTPYKGSYQTCPGGNCQPYYRR